MVLFILGINHKTAPLALRERVAFAPDRMHSALADAVAVAAVDEVAIMSTCNRTELYWVSEDSQSCAQMQSWLAAYHQVESTDVKQHSYELQGDAAIRHMMMVAGGLDSLVLGEPQIFGQIKSAYSVAKSAGTIKAQLHSAFHKTFAIAKRVRTDTAIGKNPVSVAYAAVTLAKQIFSDLRDDTALVIGAGETIELVMQHLADQGIKRMIVANRTLERAQLLAEKYGAEAILLSDLHEYLSRADIVISSTASQLPILGKGAVESALKVRRHKPMFMVDIAVPRDIEAEVSTLDDVYLFTVDDLKNVIEENMKSRQEAAEQAQTIITEGVEDFMREVRAMDSVMTIKAYRQKAEELRDQELEKALRALQNGTDPDQAMSQLARNLTNKLIHTPSTVLKDAGASGRTDMVSLVHELFEISPNDIDKSQSE